MPQAIRLDHEDVFEVAVLLMVTRRLWSVGCLAGREPTCRFA
jgi:hypothetical protein